VVASRASCLPEVAEGAALLIEPTDVDGLATALEQMLSDSTLRAQLVGRGLQRAAEYTWRGAAERLLDVYRKVAAA
jgi:glycosyltransferase involved in cell wall biosynthesis